MSHSNNILSATTERWIDEGATANPAPAIAPILAQRDKDARDTALGCRQRATDDLSRALAMDTFNGRQIFEKSAANWTKRADMLQRIETGIEARLQAPGAAAVQLTAAEIAEDAGAA